MTRDTKRPRIRATAAAGNRPADAAIARHTIAAPTEATIMADLAILFAEANAAVAAGEGAPADLDWVCRDFEEAADEGEMTTKRKSGAAHRR